MAEKNRNKSIVEGINFSIELALKYFFLITISDLKVKKYSQMKVSENLVSGTYGLSDGALLLI